MNNTPHPDEETARLLAEFSTREQLEERANALGVKFRTNVSDDTLRARIAEAEAAQAAAETEAIQAAAETEAIQAAAVAPTAPEAVQAALMVVSNPGKSVMRIGALVMAPGHIHTLTQREMADERLMAKIAHMVKLGVLHRGTD